jgi:MYXO-CTERM domain-containing protein
VFQVAAELGQPAVVNLSLGTHTGPHDGTSLASACLDNLSGPGRIIVAAAGNEGEPWIHPWLDELVYVHATGVADVARQRVDFVPGDYVGEGEIIDIWFDAPGAATLRVGVESSAGVSVVTDPVPVGEAPVEALLATPQGNLGPVLITSDRTPSGATNYQVTVLDEDADLAETEHLWFFELTDAGRYDAFLDVNGGGGFLESDTGAHVDARMSIGFPAVARNVIAVGSSVSRTQWDNANGETYETFDYLTGEPLTLGQLSTFSSRGPTRTPTLTGVKPDLVAPGEMVASAMADGFGLDIIESTVVSSAPGGYFVSGGTSQSAPVVTGIVALMLERDPTLDPERVRELLRTTATVPANVDIPSDDWGYGNVVAALAVAATPDIDPAEPPPERPPERGADGGCGCHVPSAEGAPPTGLFTLLLGLGLATFQRRRRFSCCRRTPRTVPAARVVG